MPQRASGVLTIPGFLTGQLDDLDLTRKELAKRIGVSVRTIYNIEHGGKRVDSQVLARVASVLNQRSSSLYRGAEPLGLTKHHFIASTPSIVEVAMQAIVLNRPDFMLNERALVDPSLRWWINGDPDRLNWTGSYDLASFGEQIDNFHASFQHLGIEDTEIYLDRQQRQAVVKTVSVIRHPSSQQVLKYLNFIEFSVGPKGLCAMEATFDSDVVTEFAISGRTPMPRKSGRP